MFDLFRSREKSVRIVLGGVLVMVAASMLLYLVPSYNSGMSDKEAVVAEVGGEDITVTDVKRLIEKTMKGRQLPPEVLPNYIPRIIDQMVADRALEYQATQLGFQVTDQDVATAVRQLLPAELFPGGKFAGKEAYAMMLAQQNLTIGEFEADVRRQILIHRLIDVAIEGAVVSDLEIELMFKARSEKIKIQYVKLTADQFKKEVDPSPAELQRYFTANVGQYQDPPRRNLTILYLDPNKLAETAPPTDKDLEAVYKQNIEQFRTGERVKVRHILLKTQGKPPADESRIKAQADDILRQVRGGAKFGDLVDKYTEDVASKSDAPNREPGLGAGEYWVEKNGQMVKEFETAAFTLKPGQSDVIKTTYGYHVFQVVEHQDARVKPFDEAKADLSKQLKIQRAQGFLQAASEKAETMLRADPTHPDKVAAELSMQLIRVERYEDGQAVPEIGMNPDFSRSLESLKPGEVSQPISLPGSRLVLAIVTGAIPPRQRSFEESQAAVRERLIESRLAGVLQKHAQELYDKARINNDLEGAAKSLGFQVKTSEAFSRSDTVKDLDLATHFQEGFRLADGTVYGPMLLTTGTVVARVVSHIAPDMAELPGQRAKIRDDIKSQKAKERNDLFEAGVMSELERRGKVKIHKDVIEQMIAGYLSKG
jgi:peptidyl-prolyl cis-trans isomerase D